MFLLLMTCGILYLIFGDLGESLVLLMGRFRGDWHYLLPGKEIRKGITGITQFEQPARHGCSGW